jgi:hypothetical protein
MQIITIPDVQGSPKNYTMKDTLLVKEYRQVMQTLKFLSDFASRIKSANPEDLEETAAKLNLITIDQWDFIDKVIKRCFGMTEEELDEVHNADMLFLFSELINESRTPKKKFLSPSSSESTIQPTPSS